MGHLREQDGLDALASFQANKILQLLLQVLVPQDSEAEMELVMQGIYYQDPHPQTQKREARLARREVERHASASS